MISLSRPLPTHLLLSSLTPTLSSKLVLTSLIVLSYCLIPLPYPIFQVPHTLSLLPSPPTQPLLLIFSTLPFLPLLTTSCVSSLHSYSPSTHPPFAYTLYHPYSPSIPYHISPSFQSPITPSLIPYHPLPYPLSTLPSNPLPLSLIPYLPFLPSNPLSPRPLSPITPFPIPYLPFLPIPYHPLPYPLSPLPIPYPPPLSPIMPSLSPISSFFLPIPYPPPPYPLSLVCPHPPLVT